MLRATTECTFSTSQLPKVVRAWCVLYILTWKCASRHNGVQFFISHLARWLRTRRFSEPTVRPGGATIFLKRAAKPSAGNTSTGNLLRNPVEPDLALHQSLSFLRNLLQNLLRNPVKPNLALHQTLPRFLRPGTRTSAHRSYSGLKTPLAYAVGEKHNASRLFYLFAHLHLLSSDSFSSLIFSLLLFPSLTLPTSAFPSVHIVVSLTS